MKKSDIVAQPLSMKIIRLLMNNELTVKEIKHHLTDVSQTSLYRHIKKMYDVGLLKITKEEIIKGIIKKTYTFAKENGVLTKEELNNLTKDEYEDLFMQFIAILISDFKDNLENNKNFKTELDFYQAPVYLSKKESQEMRADLEKIIKKYLNNKNTKERKLNILSLTFMPSNNKD